MNLKINLKKIEQATYDFILLFFYIALFAYMPTTRQSDRIVSIVAIAVLAFGSVIKIIMSPNRMLKLDYSLIWYLAFVAFGMLSCFWSTDTLYFETYVKGYFIIIVIAVLCLGCFIEDQESVDRQMTIIVLAGVFAALRFLYYTPLDTIFSSGYYIRGDFGLLLDNGKTNYNNYTSHLCFISIIAAYYAIVRNKKWFFIPFVLLTAIVIFGGSRKNILVIPIVTFYFSFCTGSLSKKAKNLILIISFTIAAVYFLSTLDFLSPIRKTLLQMIHGLFGSNSGITVVDKSTTERIYLIERAKEVWVEHPFLGVGWDNYRFYNDLQLYAHNNYVELLSCLGLVGFLIYYSYFARKIIYVFSNMIQHKRYSEDILFLGLSAGMFMQDVGTMTMYSRARMIILLVVLLSCSVIQKRAIRIRTKSI